MFIAYDAPPIPSNAQLDTKNLGRPQKTWFFEKENGSIIALQEAEAWRLYSGKNQILGLRTPRPKIIGVSDGTTYYQAIVEAVKIAKDIGAEQGQEAGILAGQEHMRKGFALEIEVARGHIEKPRNFDMVNQQGNPTTLNELTG